MDEEEPHGCSSRKARKRQKEDSLEGRESAAKGAAGEGPRKALAEEMPEGCRAIEGFPFYCINMSGDVYSCRTRGGRFVPWTRMTPVLRGEGNQARWVIGFRKGRKLRVFFVHCVVLMVFVGPRPAGLEGCHNDGDRDNNALSNLRWDTHKANMEDRRKHGRNVFGERNAAAILTEPQVIEIRRLYNGGKGMQQKQIAPLFKVSKQAIQVACTGETWKHIPLNP